MVPEDLVRVLQLALLLAFVAFALCDRAALPVVAALAIVASAMERTTNRVITRPIVLER
jgi:hypothetical protein